MKTPSLSRRISALLPLTLLLGAVHCSGGSLLEKTADGGPTTDGEGPPPTPLGPPTNHRPAAPSCSTTRPPGINDDAGVPDAGFPIQGACSRDADCTQGTNGRCLPPQHNAAGNYCSYDACATDTDCGAGKLCECGVGGGSLGRTGNTCLPGNCRVDTDCGAGGYCSPTYDTSCGSYSGTVGYYCHTASDTCTNDSDCSDGGVNGYCAWQPTVGKWACSYGFCAG